MLINSPEGNYRVRKNKDKKKGPSNIQYQLNYFKIFFFGKYIRNRTAQRVTCKKRTTNRDADELINVTRTQIPAVLRTE
jgi:hypothetical protein